MKPALPASFALLLLYGFAPATAIAGPAAGASDPPLPACNRLVESCSLDAGSDPSPASPAPARISSGSRAFAGGAFGRGGEIPTLKPFSTFALALKVGVGGVGLDVATPLSQRTNLRAGASFFAYSTNVNDSGLNIDGTLDVRRVGLSLDVFPFHGAFRISPGVTLYNGNGLRANAFAPGGGQFDLGDTTYTSDPTDPVHGSAVVDFGRKVAPSLTVGFGNMIPRSGAHFSFPFEAGFEYNSAPALTLNLAGSACQGADCGSITSDPDIVKNVKQEQVDFNNSIRPLRFFPIFSFGVGYRF